MFRLRIAPLVLAIVTSLFLVSAPGASAASHAKKQRKAAVARSFTGTVSSVTPRRKSLSLKTARGVTVRLAVTRATKGTRLRGLKRGQVVSVRATRVRGAWVASQIAKRVTPVADDDQATSDDQATDDSNSDEVDEQSDDVDDDTGDDADTPVDGDATDDGSDTSADPLDG